MNHIHRELIPNENIEVKQAPFFELYREATQKVIIILQKFGCQFIDLLNHNIIV